MRAPDGAGLPSSLGLGRRAIVVALFLVSVVSTGMSVSAAPSAPAAWQPEAATYGVGVTRDVAVTMADGVVLRADVYSPLDTATGKAASGSFPVVLAQTPYGKDSGDGLTRNSLVGPFPYMVQRGYINAVVDVRGTGASQGSFGLFDEAQVQDAVRVVHWAARLPGSNGNVGLYGESYLAINQLSPPPPLAPIRP